MRGCFIEIYNCHRNIHWLTYANSNTKRHGPGVAKPTITLKQTTTAKPKTTMKMLKGIHAPVPGQTGIVNQAKSFYKV